MARGMPRPLTALAISVSVLAMAACGSPDAGGGDSTPTAPMGTTAPVEPTTDAEADCPEPAPGSPTGAVDDPFAPGEQIVVECFTVVVDSLERDANATVAAENEGATPGDGNVFMTATVTITRSGGDPADAADVEVNLGGSMTTSGEPDPDLTVEPGPPSGTLAVGETVTGTYVYEVSGGASVSVEIRVGTMPPLNVLPY